MQRDLLEEATLSFLSVPALIKNIEFTSADASYSHAHIIHKHGHG